MKKITFLFVLIALMLVTGCEKHNKDSNHSNNFTISARASHSPMAGETFSVEVTLENMSDIAYTLHSGNGGLSYIAILDDEGKTVQPPMFRTELVTIALKPNQPYVEKWVVKIEKPGKYHVVAHSQYSVGDENKDLRGGLPHVHNIKSEPAEVIIR